MEMVQEDQVDVAEVGVVVEPNSFMTSEIPKITFITDHYYFLKTSPLTQIENNLFRRKKMERQARKAIMRFSKYDHSRINDYSPEEQNEIITWINIAIAECFKGRKQNQRGSNI